MFGTYEEAGRQAGRQGGSVVVVGRRLVLKSRIEKKRNAIRIRNGGIWLLYLP
jgi:hypothetical protein